MEWRNATTVIFKIVADKECCGFVHTWITSNLKSNMIRHVNFDLYDHDVLKECAGIKIRIKQCFKFIITAALNNLFASLKANLRWLDTLSSFRYFIQGRQPFVTSCLLSRTPTSPSEKVASRLLLKRETPFVTSCLFSRTPTSLRKKEST